MDARTNLKLIEDMIYTAKQEVGNNGFFFLLWGWLVFAAAVLQVGMYYAGLSHNELPWVILMPAGAIISIFASRRKRQEQRVRTWFDDVMKYLWIAFGVVLGLIFFLMFGKGINLYPIVIALYGLGLFITGGTLRFKPLIIGGIICWVLSLGCMYADNLNSVILLGLSVLFGYIIPGHILQNRAKKNV